MSSIQFGKIFTSDIHPGFVMRNNSGHAYVVKERTGEPRSVGKCATSDSGWHVPFTADVYTKQADGSYLKTGETKVSCPVGFFQDGSNPHFDPVTITKREGNLIWIEG